MFRKSFLISLLLILVTSIVSAQKITKPTLTPKEATPEQQKIIQEGIRFHDQKLYDEAIAKYQDVLKVNPDSDLALYELALTYYEKKDYKKVLETGFELIQYKSKTAIAGFGIIANALDDQGESKKAIELYKDAIDVLKNDKEFSNHVSSLYFNLGITYYRQKLAKEAREAFKQAVNYNYAYSSPHYLLAEVFFSSRYKIPALLAASRLISLEMNTQRSKRASLIFQDVIRAGATKGDNGNINISLDFDAPKDEGDFSSMELFLGFGGALKDDKESKKTAEESFVESVETLIVNIEADQKKNGKTFVGKNYFPFLLEIKQKGYIKPFAYLVLQQGGNETAEKWLIENSKLIIEFINWAKSYQLPTK